MQRTIKLGKCKDAGDVEVQIELRTTPKGEELSIVGNVWRRDRRDIIAGGQLERGLLDYLDESTFTPSQVNRLLDVWHRWHLNGLRAECEHQRARGETWTTHASAQCPECGYKLGHAWLFEPLPPDVRAEVVRWIETGTLVGDQPDYVVRYDGGSVALLVAQSDEAREHMQASTNAEGWQWLGNGLAVEPRYLEGLVDGLTEEGYTVGV